MSPCPLTHSQWVGANCLSSEVTDRHFTPQPGGVCCVAILGHSTPQPGGGCCGAILGHSLIVLLSAELWGSRCPVIVFGHFHCC